MELTGKYVIFDQSEQDSFHVRELVPVSDALQIASGFEIAVESLQNRAKTFEGSTARADVGLRNHLLGRATELGIFSEAIRKTCNPSAVDEFIGETLDS